ncbi:TAP domain-containing protein, partial [Pseudomassariella vexata]
RGGISKRRGGGATRIDRDGDLDMDAPVVNGAARGTKDSPAPTEPGRRSTRSTTTSCRPPKPTTRAQQAVARVISSGTGSLASRISSGIDTSSRAGRASRPINAADTMTLKVDGLKTSRAVTNSDGGLKALLTFLERKAATVGKLSRTVRIKKSQLKGDSVYITTSKDDGEEILKINGFEFAATKLAISDATEEAPATSAGTQEVKELLTNVLSLRYDQGTKLLNLANLGQDARLNEMGVFNESNPLKVFRALMAICDEKFKTAQAKREAIVSVSLAGNNIDDVTQISSLTDTFPDLTNLDLSYNQFKELKSLRKWSRRLRNMETLLLNGNPIEQHEPLYQNELKAWFPKLQNLSGSQVRTAEEVAAADSVSKPTPIPNIGPDFRDINRVGETFITEFMQMYDVDRQNLVAKYYDDKSTFSLTVNTRAPYAPDVPLSPWTSYIKLSRNHTKITTQHGRQQRLFVGTSLIQSAWQNLPPTRHPDLTTQFDKYTIDCHPVGGFIDPSGQNAAGVDGMIMTLHGEFEDQDPDTKKTAKRTFSRTFLLGPGAPGRHPIRVVSDMLSLKAYNPLPPVTPVAASASSEDAQKQQMVLELCQQSGMTPEYSKFCLEAANWNFDQAMVTFN